MDFCSEAYRVLQPYHKIEQSKWGNVMRQNRRNLEENEHHDTPVWITFCVCIKRKPVVKLKRNMTASENSEQGELLKEWKMRKNIGLLIIFLH